MGKRILIDVPNMPIELKYQVEKTLNGALQAGDDIASNNVSSFSDWLKNRNFQLWYKVKPYIDEVFDSLKSFAEGFLEGFGMITIATVGTPIVGLYEGVKEGFENGLEAGIEKGVKAMGNFLKNVFD